MRISFTQLVLIILLGFLFFYPNSQFITYLRNFIDKFLK